MPTTGNPVRASTIKPRFARLIGEAGTGLFVRCGDSQPQPKARLCSTEERTARRVGFRGIMTSLRRTTLGEYLRVSVSILLKEVSAFGLIGAPAFVIDVGL